MSGCSLEMVENVPVRVDPAEAQPSLPAHEAAALGHGLGLMDDRGTA